VPCSLFSYDRTLAAKHQISEADRCQLVLVMIYPTREEDGSLTRILHSLKPHETPMHVRYSYTYVDIALYL
jgi:hypothetical protein